MGTFFACKSCRRNQYLREQKEELSNPQPITCYFCHVRHNYYTGELQQECYDLSCPVCNGRFHVRRPLPITVRCPHSNSLLFVSSDGGITIYQQGTPPNTTHGGTAAGAIGGLALGALLGGAAGAILGALAGAAVGSTANSKEAIYTD